MASRPTKYAHVVGSLPRYDGISPDRKAIVDAVRAEIRAAQTAEEEANFNLAAQVRSSTQQLGHSVAVVLGALKRLASGRQNAAGFAAAYAEARLALDAVDGWRASAQLLVDAYEGLMLDAYEAEGVSSLRLEGGASVSTYAEPYGQVVDKEAFRRWCVAPADRCMVCGGDESALGHRGGDELSPGEPYPFERHAFRPGGGLERQLQLWPSTMNAIAKERTLAGEPPPDGVEVYAKTMVRLNKA